MAVSIYGVDIQIILAEDYANAIVRMGVLKEKAFSNNDDGGQGEAC